MYLTQAYSYCQFCLKFRCHGNRGRSWYNLSDIIQYQPDPKKPLLGARISAIFLTQAELQHVLSQISLPWQQGVSRSRICLTSFSSKGKRDNENENIICAAISQVTRQLQLIIAANIMCLHAVNFGHCNNENHSNYCQTPNYTDYFIRQ